MRLTQVIQLLSIIFDHRVPPCKCTALLSPYTSRSRENSSVLLLARALLSSVLAVDKEFAWVDVVVWRWILFISCCSTGMGVILLELLTVLVCPFLVEFHSKVLAHCQVFTYWRLSSFPNHQVRGIWHITDRPIGCASWLIPLLILNDEVFQPLLLSLDVYIWV